MSSQAFFQACQEGENDKLLELLQSDEEVDVNSKDGYGMTALAYAARNGHVEVVRELLSRGADRTEVLEQGYGKSIPEIAQLLEEGVEGSNSSQGQEATEAGDQGIHLHQMPDPSFINGGYAPQGYPMMPGFGGMAPGQQYYYDGMHVNGVPAGSGGRPSQQQGHLKKDSNANLPPPEVARGIPCKFFPNCRYGDKCMFAHPIMAMLSGPPGSAPLSPSMSQPPMQPLYYQQMPAGYPYPGPYGGGPQFYPPMGPMNPMQQQYGIPSPFNPSSIQSLPLQHSQIDGTSNGSSGPVNDDTKGAVEANSEQADEAVANSSHTVPETGSSGQEEHQSAMASTHDEDAAKQSTLDLANERIATGTPPQQDGANPFTSSGLTNGDEEAKSKEGGEGSAQEKPIHRRQSFNSFLHHHAVPFQPNLQPGTEMGMMGAMQPFPPRMGPKSRRVQGVNGFSKGRNGERPSCTFFAGGRCKFGDECRFPHILPDGTDARPMQAQQRQIYAAQFGAANGVVRATDVNGVSAPVNSSVPPSAPTGPQAEKKVASEKQQSLPARSESSPSQQSKSLSQSTPVTNGANVVRSNPSKTSTQAANGAPRGQHGNGSSSKKQQQQQHLQPAQRIPTVNDFPALAGSSPNPSGQTASTPLSPSLPVKVTTAVSNDSSDISTSAPTNPVVTPTPTVLTSTIAPTRANFSAILSAPAPAKSKLQTDTATAASSKAAGTEDDSHTEDSNADGSVRANGEEKSTKTQAKSNGIAKDGKVRAKEIKTGKADSYKAVAAGLTKPINGSQEDEFQLVNRSRTSNKRVSSNPNNVNSSDGYAAQSNAVTA